MCSSSFGVLSLIVAFILIGFYFFKRQRQRTTELLKNFEGPEPVVLLGNTLQFMGTPTKALEKLRGENEKHPARPYLLWFLIKPVIVIHHHTDVQTVFKILRKDSSYSCLRDLIGDGLITSNGDKWKRSRAMIEPAFNTHMLSDHIFLILVKHSNNLVVELRQQGKKELDIWPHVYKTAFNSIHDITMGFDEKLDEEKVTKFEKNRCAELMIQRIYSPWLYPPLIFKIFTFLVTGLVDPFHEARSLFAESIERCKRRYRDRKYHGNIENEKNKIIMDILLDAGSYSDKDIHDEIMTLLFAGTETTATTVSHTLLMLAMNPNIQAKVYDELQGVLNNSDSIPHASDLSKLTFLEQCIKESLRTTAPPVVIRTAKTDTTLNDGRIVPAGTAYLLSIFDVHHDQDIYPDPYTWNPHHFDPEKVATRPANCFVPFGTGARICLGYRYSMMAMKVMLLTVLRNFKLRTNQTGTTLDFSIIVRIKEGYNVELHPRKMKMVDSSSILSVIPEAENVEKQKLI